MVEREVKLKDDAELDGDAVIDACVGIMVAGVFNSIGEGDNTALVGVEVTGVDVIVDVAKDDTALENAVVNGDIVAVKDDTALENAVLTVKSDIGVVDVAGSDGIMSIGKENIRLEVEAAVDGGTIAKVVRGATKGVDKGLKAAAVDGGTVASVVRDVIRESDAIKVLGVVRETRVELVVMMTCLLNCVVKGDVELNDVAVDNAVTVVVTAHVKNVCVG